VRPDGTILFNKRKQFITTSLAGEFIGLQSLDDRYVQVFYANVMLGFIDAQRPEYGLVRPKVHRGKQQTTKLNAQRSAPKTSRSKGKRRAQRTKRAQRDRTRVTKRDMKSAAKARRR
jgi:hypothetical protein